MCNDESIDNGKRDVGSHALSCTSVGVMQQEQMGAYDS